MFRTIACTLALTFVLCSPFTTATAQGYGAEIHLTNGSVLRGTVVDQDADCLALVIEGVGAPAITVQMLDVSSIVQLAGAAPAPPAPVVTAPHDVAAQAVVPASTGRFMGFGFNTSVGFGHKYTTNAMLTDPEHFDGHMDLELPGFELRLFPEGDDFSLDLLFKFGSAAQYSMWATANGFGSWAGTNVALMNLYFHFWGAPVHAGDGLVAFSFAPGLTFGAGSYYTVLPVGGQIGFSMRIGAEFSNTDRTFGFGVHFRPGAFVGVLHEDEVFYQDVMPGAEGMIEFSWTWYVPRPAGA